jgi:membrane fusion protein (multidrug efflux system)
VLSGLKAGEKVVVDGLQRVKAGGKARPVAWAPAGSAPAAAAPASAPASAASR